MKNEKIKPVLAESESGMKNDNAESKMEPEAYLKGSLRGTKRRGNLLKNNRLLHPEDSGLAMTWGISRSVRRIVRAPRNDRIGGSGQAQGHFAC